MYKQWSLMLILYCALADESLDEKIKDESSVTLYSTYNIEENCLNNRSTIIGIKPWEAAILRLGYLYGNGIPLSQKIHKCKLTIQTKKNFWLVATIERMKIRGVKNKENNAWQCSDYIEFSSPKRNILNRVLGVFSIDFGSKKSDELCGENRLDADNLDKISDVTTHANSFSTSNNEIELYLHQENDERHRLNNSFTIIITTFRHASEQVFAVECEGKQKCYGRDIFCIDKSFVCDGHVNCAFPGSGTDERLCKVESTKPTVFDTTSVIIVILTSMVSLGILLCVISSIKNRIFHRSSSRRHSLSVTDNLNPTAPRLQNEAPLPPYESVILSDISEEGKGYLDTNEAPPKYESLFPDSINSPPSAGSLKDDSRADVS